MYVTPEELELRLKSQTEIIEKSRKYTGSGKNLTNAERLVAGNLSALIGQDNAAEVLGISQTSASYYERGLVGGKRLDTELRDEVKEENKKDLGKIKDAALDNLVSALSRVGEGIDNVKTLDASKIATDMSKIVRNLDPNKDTGSRTAIILHKVNQKKEEQYETITV